MINSEEFMELKQKVLKMERILYIPKFISLSDIASDLGVSRQSLTYHLKTNYKEEVDYKIKNGRILIDVSILQNIKAIYEK